MSVISFQTSLQNIRTLLSGDVDSNDLAQISNEVQNFDTEESNRFIRSLDEATLTKWIHELRTTQTTKYDGLKILSWEFGEAYQTSRKFSDEQQATLIQKLAPRLTEAQLLSLCRAVSKEGTPFLQDKLIETISSNSSAYTRHYLVPDLKNDPDPLAKAFGNKLEDFEASLIQDITGEFTTGFEADPRDKESADELKGIPKASKKAVSTATDGDTQIVRLRESSESNLVRVHQFNREGAAPSLEISIGKRTWTVDNATNVKIIGTNGKQNLFLDDSITTTIDVNMRGGDDAIISNAYGKVSVDGGRGNDSFFGSGGEHHFNDQSGRNSFSVRSGTNKIDAGGAYAVIAATDGKNTLDVDADKTAVYTGHSQANIRNRDAEMVVYSQNAAAVKVKTDNDAETKLKKVADNNSVLGNSLVIQGSAEFSQRVEADIDMLRSSPDGRAMLSALDKTAETKGHKTYIDDYHAALMNSTATTLFGDNPAESGFSANGRPGKGTNSQVSYNPFISVGILSPFRTIFHELGHGLTINEGTEQRVVRDANDNPTGKNLDSGETTDNPEPQVMGWRNTGVAYDSDHNPATPKSTHLPLHLSEKGLALESLDIVRKRHDQIS